MLRATALALTAGLMLAGSPVSAQVIDLGRGGPRIDLRSDRDRERDYYRERARRDMHWERRRAYGRDDLYTGSVRPGCKTITIQERDAYGRMITRTRERCR